MLKTKVWKAGPGIREDDPSIQEAASLLRAGEVIGFPTETVYGLGADATSTAAAEKIFQAKGRPSDNPLIVHICDREQLKGIVSAVPPAAEALMDRFWPGPLTIVFPVKTGVLSPRVTAGLDTVAVRMPDHPVAVALLRAASLPVAAPSANLSGRPSATTAEHVLEDFCGRIAGVIDGGPVGIGLESTVVEIVEKGKIRVLRPGGITLGQLKEAVTEVEVDRHVQNPSMMSDGNSVAAPRSPGMKYRHYAPRGTLQMVKGDFPEVLRYIQTAVDRARISGEKTGVLTFEERMQAYDADVIVGCGSIHDLERAAHELYAALRRLDAEGATWIVSDLLAAPHDPDGIGFALANRLLKAAGGRMVEI